MTFLLIPALAFLVLSILLFWFSNRRRGQAGLPGWHVIYEDTRAWNRAVQTLYDPVFALTGRPDYLVEKNGQIIPVEVKSGHAPPSPHESHIFQLAAYCLLVERNYGKRPPHGIIHYPGRGFAVDYTPALEAGLVEVLEQLRTDERSLEVNRSHGDRIRCLRCGYRANCDQRLG